MPSLSSPCWPGFPRLQRQDGWLYCWGCINFPFLLAGTHSQLSTSHLMSLYDETGAVTWRATWHCTSISNFPVLPKILRDQSATLMGWCQAGKARECWNYSQAPTINSAAQPWQYFSSLQHGPGKVSALLCALHEQSWIRCRLLDILGVPRGNRRDKRPHGDVPFEQLVT